MPKSSNNSDPHFYLLPHPALEKFINMAKQRCAHSILEMGCKTGTNLLKLAESGFSVSGIDISPSSAALTEKWLHEKGIEGNIIVGNFDDKIEDFQINSFDGIIAINSLENGAKGELERNIAQIVQLLKQTGLLLIAYEKAPKASGSRKLKPGELSALISKGLHVIEETEIDDSYVVFAEKM